MIRSIYEGIAFSHRWHYERLSRCMERPPESIRLVGGAAKSPVWAQIFADVMKLPVETSAIDETGAHGCAIAASIAAGDHPDIEAALKAMTRLSEPIMPRREYFAAYDRKYAVYEKIIQALEPVWDEFTAQ